MNIFFDFDGTLVDVSRRYYSVYNLSIARVGGVELPKVKLWSMKRDGISWNDILNQSQLCTPEQKKLFMNIFRGNIEKEEMLKQDRLLNGVMKMLVDLEKDHQLFLATLRKSRTALLIQLEQLQLRHRFKKILTVDGIATDKKKMIRPYACRGVDVLVGDTELDVLVARSLGLKSIAISTGMRTREFLSRYEPNYIIDSCSWDKIGGLRMDIIK